MDLSKITTRDVLAVMTVAATLVFNGVSVATGRPVEAATLALAGAVIGYYFKDSRLNGGAANEAPLAPPSLPGESD